ncbi:hypothetical protein D9611_012611 [Ephemerocybe angulata]|uniref:carbonic anhydrase n=1 Tax=Ephemerocybe angulata TaxID=980116 RepID=A0A8H5ESY6_9AGAR|nr:hypothetical protein D9611_012611 [Tulosesus angulatus]
MSQDNPRLLEGLALRGQRPPFMIVDCSDSRVNEGAIFDADPGTMFAVGNIANMFEEGDVSSNAVLTYAVGTLKVKHVVIMGHYGCGGVAASMAPLPEGYAERWLGHTTLPALPSSPLSSPSSSGSSSSAPSSTSASSSSRSSAPEEPADLAVQRWILPIRKIYETSGRPEIREHRERVQRLLSSPSTSTSTATPEWSRERVARVLMGAEKLEDSGEKGEIGEVKLHDGAFRALVEENVKANVWRLGRSRVIREVWSEGCFFPPHLPFSSSRSGCGVSVLRVVAESRDRTRVSGGYGLMGGPRGSFLLFGAVRSGSGSSRLWQISPLFMLIPHDDIVAGMWPPVFNLLHAERPDNGLDGVGYIPPVARVMSSLDVGCHHEAYTKALSTSELLHPVYVHGWVYDLETGVVSDLGVSAGPPGWVPPPGGVQGFPAMRGA